MRKLEEAKKILLEKLSKRIYPSVVVRLAEAGSIGEIRKMVAKGDFWPGMAYLEEEEMKRLMSTLRIKGKREEEWVTVKGKEGQLIIRDEPEMFAEIANMSNSTVKVERGRIIQCSSIRVLGGDFDYIRMSSHIDMSRGAEVEGIANSTATMRGSSKAGEVSESIVEMMDRSVIALAQNSQIRTGGESILGSSRASWISINGGKKVVLGRGAIGWAERQVSTEIIVGVGSVLKAPDFFDHRNVKIQGGRVEIIK